MGDAAVAQSLCEAGSILCSHLPLPPRSWFSPTPQEAIRLQQLRHPHVVGFFGVSIDDAGRGILILEFCQGGCVGGWLGGSVCRSRSASSHCTILPNSRDILFASPR